MHYQTSVLWEDPIPSDISSQLEKIFSSFQGKLFFRADDIGVPGKNFTHLIEVFSKHSVPLCMAVVPTWATTARWQQIRTLCNGSRNLWCWHQHGWTHTNHEASGKKCEFGASRSRSELQHDIARGKSRLENILASDFTPVFTPPWNRCSDQALNVLKELGFSAISRSQGAKPPSPAGLPDFSVNVDLHTRKEPSADTCWTNLLGEFFSAVDSGTCGVMIHHQRMNENAFLFLDILLTNIVKLNCSLTTFRN